MAAATKNHDTGRSEGKLKAYKMGAVKIFRGTLVRLDATGFAVPATDAATGVFAGVAYEQVDNSTGAAGAKSIRVVKDGEYEFAVTGAFTQAGVGNSAFVSDDQTVSAVATVNSFVAGKFAEFLTSTKGRIRIDNQVS